jgi:phosphoglycerate transport regulatory protein PgtC
MKTTQWIGALALLVLSQQAAATEQVVVLTSYPQEVVTPFEAAFEQAYPQYRLEILWRQSRDALSYLHQKHAPIDVYWTPAQHNFAVLAKEGAFKKLDLDFSGLPNHIGGFQISDPQDRYVATEIAGFGMAYHPAEIEKLGLKAPSDWHDLTDPAYRDHIAFPIPSKVGYAPMLVDTLLQGYGWDAGWTLLRKIAANAKLADAGATFISDDVGSGTVAVGATIDFFAVSAIANGKPLKFTYPRKVGYSPAHVAIFQDAAHPDGARAFANFVLSEQGQQLLFHPDIRKLPVRPAVYQNKPEGYFDPFAAAQQASYAYDLNVSLARQELVSALFDALITRHHQTLQTLWTTLEQARQKSPNDPRLQEALLNAQWLPVSEAESRQAVLQGPFTHHQAQDSASIERDWGAKIEQHYAHALQLTREILAGP